jgi:hypothetical protein
MNFRKWLSSRTRAVLLVASLGLAASTSFAAGVYTLGEQDYSDGDVTLASFFNNLQAGEPAPFSGFIGSDLTVQTNFSAVWTFSFVPGPADSASITMGLFDHDGGFGAGTQLASFSLDGVDLTSSLDALMEATPAVQALYSVFTVPLNGAALAALADGTAEFSLSLQGPAGCCSSSTGQPFPSNGAGLDFATLTIVSAVPEPHAYAMMLAGLGLLGVMARRRASRQH